MNDIFLNYFIFRIIEVVVNEWVALNEKSTDSFYKWFYNCMYLAINMLAKYFVGRDQSGIKE